MASTDSFKKSVGFPLRQIQFQETRTKKAANHKINNENILKNKEKIWQFPRITTILQIK